MWIQSPIRNTGENTPENFVLTVLDYRQTINMLRHVIKDAQVRNILHPVLSFNMYI